MEHRGICCSQGGGRGREGEAPIEVDSHAARGEAVSMGPEVTKPSNTILLKCVALCEEEGHWCVSGCENKYSDNGEDVKVSESDQE